MVSTDDEEIAEVCRQYGAEVPFIRPLELADDKAATGQNWKQAELMFKVLVNVKT